MRVLPNPMKAKTNTSEARHAARLKWPRDPRPQFKPQVAQSKSRAVAPVTSVSFGRERNSSPSAPLAYRPQPVPKVLQLKRHEVKKLGGIAMPQNAVRSPFTPPAPQKVLPKSLTPPSAPRPKAATSAHSPRQAKPLCVQAKTSSSLPSRPLAWSVPKHPSANVASRSIQLAAKAKLKKVEEGEVDAKAEVKKGGTLSEIAKRIHLAAGGSPDKNTTGVARLKSGQLVVVTQLVLSKVVKAAAKEGIHTVTKTNGAGYHCEVSLFIKYGNKIKAIGASQGFCPHCAEFLLAKGISMVGELREADDQVWFCPEYFSGKEKEEGAKYPWAKMLAQPENERIIFDTKAEFATWYKSRTGDDLPW